MNTVVQERLAGAAGYPNHPILNRLQPWRTQQAGNSTYSGPGAFASCSLPTQIQSSSETKGALEGVKDLVQKTEWAFFIGD